MANDGGSRSARLTVALRSSLRELVIVMFGVLLALWVNNWNERRKDARLGATYLERLAADVQLDTTMRNSMIRLSDAKASDLDTLDVLLRLPSGEMFDTLKFLRAIAGGSRQAFANPPVARTTFSELENTGGLRLIADPQLRSDIARYYMSAEYSDIRIDRRRTSYGPLSYRLVPQSSGVLNDPPKSAWNRLVRDARSSDLRGSVGAERNYTRFFRQEQSRLLKDAKELLAKIENASN